MLKNGKVLVVEVFEPNLHGLRQMLERANYTVFTAMNGSEALTVVKAERPDLVLLDVLMPGVSGLDVCTALKRDAATCLTPVVLISGAQERETRIAGLDAGADDYLSKPIDAEELCTRVRSLLRLKRLTDELESAQSLFLTLGRVIEARDPYIEGHCDRLADHATALGRRLKLERSDLDALHRGAFLHDIGKIAIPDRLLLKKGRLTSREYDVMKRHAIIGDELCATVRSLEAVRPIVRHHHERIDGRGYPDGLSGARVPLLAQIVSVVDVFDALTTDRPYRKAIRTETAYKMLVESAESGWCEARLAHAFVELHRARSPRRSGPRFVLVHLPRAQRGSARVFSSRRSDRC
jgi:putative two-component system response regulator